MQIWADGLRGVSGEQARRALTELVLTGQDWPPSLPKFRALCTGSDPGNREWRAFEARVQAQEFIPAGYLPQIPAERLSPDEALTRIRDILQAPRTSR